MAEPNPVGRKGRIIYRSPNMIVRFKLDRGGIRKCAVGPELRASCHEFVTTVALPYAMRIAPRSRRVADPEKPHYQDSFRVQDVITGKGPEEIVGDPPMRRVGTRLLNVSPHAIIVEVGPGPRRGARVLGKTLNHIQTLGTEEN